MSETTQTIKSLAPSARWIFIGNLLTALGFLAVSIGQILKVAESGTMEPFNNPTTFKSGQPERAVPAARDYFS